MRHSNLFRGAAFAALLLAPLAANAQSSGVTIEVNGSPVTFDQPPIERVGRIYVPLRGVFEQLGASVVYQDGLINATSGSHQISLRIGSPTATVDGAQATLDSPPFLIGGRTLVPLRFLSQALGASVDYDDSTQTVYIATGPTQGAEGIAVDVAPPPLPVYDQPPAQAPNELWMPGYWTWGPGGYSWVPGTWIAAPRPGLLWTPGYWARSRNAYAWHPGYWANRVGFYGGVNYGFGYFGTGYVGGRWDGVAFRYNAAVTHVNTTLVHNVYIDRTVITNSNVNHRVSYSGGPGGTAAQPEPRELNTLQERRVPATPVQRQHINEAANNHNFLVSTNQGRPTIRAVARPLDAAHRPSDFAPVTADERRSAQVHVVRAEPPQREQPRTREQRER